MQRITLEIVLRAIFGVERPGGREPLRAALTSMLELDARSRRADGLLVRRAAREYTHRLPRVPRR